MRIILSTLDPASPLARRIRAALTLDPGRPIVAPARPEATAERWRRAGGHYAVARSVAEARSALVGWGIIKREGELS